MAFGFGFNKQKVLNTAEKFVQQGKLQNAITEYGKILKADAKDLTVMNTVGDLYARLGQVDQAVEHFKNVGDAYAAQGFTVKAIAMYKKLSKLKPSLDCVLRLAELYTQQGLFNDARAQYKQVAEEFLRTGELEQAVRIFQKILEMDPENVAMRTKLAEVYLGLGKKAEAWQIFSAAAENLRGRGLVGAAVEIVQRMLIIDPANNEAMLLRGRLAFDSGDIAGAVQQLEKVADLDSHADGLRTLMQCYAQTGRLAEAGTMAAKLLSVHNDTSGILSYADALIAANRFESALQVYQQNSEKLLAANSPKVLESLHNLIGHIRGNTDALEVLLSILNKSGESTHLTEVYELLAHACVQTGELEKARAYYLRLTQLEPQNQIHARNYQQVASRLGASTSTSLISVEEGVSLVDELEATAPFVDQRYPDDVALAVRAAITDAELYTSYNMSEKALEPLTTILPRAPQDLRLNQRLAAIYTRNGQFAEAATCCRMLERIYHDAGHPDEATRYGELAGKYEERAGAKLVDSAAAFGAPAAGPSYEPQPEIQAAGGALTSQPAEIEGSTARPAAAAKASGLFWYSPPAPAAEAPAASFAEPELPAPSAKKKAQSEIDLSDEWEGAITEEPAIVVESAAGSSPIPAVHDAAATEVIAETVAEIRFYLTHSMVEQARATLAKLHQLHPDAATLKAITDEVAAAAFAETKTEAVSIEPVSIEEFVTEAEATPATNWPAIVPPAAMPASAPAAAAMQHSALGDFVADLESSLGDNFSPAAKPPQPAAPRTGAAAAVAATSQQGVASSAAGSFGSAAAAPARAQESTTPPMFTYQPRPLAQAEAPRAAASTTIAGIDLSDMFGELRQELEADPSTTTTEDSETHYNLGVAFREMGLLDEAIGELQKVCQAVERGQSFPQVMQTYTWLAQCFLDKGVPEAAIRWYEKALQLPALDGETKTALHYEMACAYEAAKNKPLALKHFLEVYGSNIDYRDVAERIQALKS
jgi:pilus assembly protein FimV